MDVEFKQYKDIESRFGLIPNGGAGVAMDYSAAQASAVSMSILPYVVLAYILFFL